MVRSSSAAILVVPMAVGVSGPATVRAHDTPATYTRRADAPPTGVTKLGVVVEDLGPRFAASGLKKGATNIKE